MMTRSGTAGVPRAKLWILAFACIAVHMMFAAMHVTDSLNYMRRNPFPVTSLAMGGGISPLWHENQLLYLPALGEGIRRTSSKGGIPSGFMPGEWSVLGDISTQAHKLYAIAGTKLYVFDLAKRSSPYRIEIDLPVYSVAASPNGSLAVIVSSGGARNVGILDANQRIVRIVTPYTNEYDPLVHWSSVSWCSKGERILFGPIRKRGTPNSGTLVFVDTSTLELTPQFTVDDIWAFALGPCDQIAYSDTRGRLHIIEEDGHTRLIADNCLPGTRNPIDWSSDGNWIAYEGRDENIWIVRGHGADGK